MHKVLFALKKKYYWNALFPLYQALSKDNNYDLWIRVGKDAKQILRIFDVPQKNRIKQEFVQKGYQVTEGTLGFDAVICGDALRKPERYGDCLRVHVDHGVGIKTLRIRNVQRQKDFHYHVFLEGQAWYDFIKSLGWENVADFHITGLPKLDPFFWQGYYDSHALQIKLGLHPEKKTVLFAPSYNPSCIQYLRDKIEELVPEYNLVIKLHPYSWGGKYAPRSQHRLYERMAKQYQEVFLIPKEEYDIYPYLILADTMISDTSSVVNEFLALGKFGIIYILPNDKLNHSDGMPKLSVDPAKWLEGAFPRMSEPDELHQVVEAALNPSDEMKKQLTHYRNYYFTKLDGQASHRVKQEIDKLLKGAQ